MDESDKQKAEANNTLSLKQKKDKTFNENSASFLSMKKQMSENTEFYLNKYKPKIEENLYRLDYIKEQQESNVVF